MEILGYEFCENDAKKEAADFWEIVAKHVKEDKFIFNENKELIYETTDKKIEDTLICEAVRRSFHDLTVRTMTRKDKTKPVKPDELAKEACDEKGLLEKIKEWFEEKTVTDYDTWHRETCENIIIKRKI